MSEKESVRTGAVEVLTNPDMVYQTERVFVRAIASGKYSLREELRRQREGKRVFKPDDRPWTGGPTKWNKVLMNPGMGMTQTIQVAFEELAPGAKSQKHGHQNSALMYVLNGVGYDIHDGERTDWRPGDCLIVPPGVVHQHFNASDEQPARILIIKSKPLFNFAGLNFQEFVELPEKTPRPGWEDFHPGEWEARH
jgi:quercetin dioxygenase-like cupin family protein